MRTLVLLLMLLASPALAADWIVGPAPSEDPTVSAATVRNEAGDALLLWGREADGRYQVFAELHLGGGETFGTEMLRYRINGGETSRRIRSASRARSSARSGATSVRTPPSGWSGPRSRKRSCRATLSPPG